MKVIGARFRGDADDPALIIAELRGGVLGDDIEFLDRIYIGHEAGFIVLVFAVELPIQEVLVGLLTVAVDERTAGIIQVVRLVQALRVVGGRTRCEQS